MSPRRLIPDDDTLRRVFAEHPDWPARQFVDHYGWPVTRYAVAQHRRRLMTASPIAGTASMSAAEFRAACDESAAVRHWAVTGFDNQGVTRIHSGGEKG